MWQSLKIWGLRKFYRHVSALGWRGHLDTPQWNTLEIPGPAGPIGARMFSEHSREDRPLIVYFHGGGWVLGDLDTHTPFCQLLHQRSGCNVIAVDYRLAPEHPFPASSDDCLAATQWIAEHPGDFGTSDHRIVVAGDSAGGNLSAAVCLAANPALRDKIAGEIAIYPVTDHYEAGFASYKERATGQTLTANLMRWFWDTYLAGQNPDAASTAHAFPARSAHLSTLPPTFLVTAEKDPLRDEGVDFNDKLETAGVSVSYRHFENAAHGFAGSEGPSEDLDSMMEDLVAWLDTV